MNCHSKQLATIAIAAIFLSLTIYGANAQEATQIAPSDKFEIPNGNGTIRFAVNATAGKVQLQSDSWVFENLKIGNFSQFQQNLNLTASVKNSNILITAYTYARSNTSLGTLRLRYTVEGNGVQTFNFGPLPKGGIWNVVVGAVFLGQKDGWTVSKEGTVTVTWAQSGSNISIIYYVFPDFYVQTINQSFYQRNSVAVNTAIILIVIVVIAVLVRKFTKKLPETSEFPDSNQETRLEVEQ